MERVHGLDVVLLSGAITQKNNLLGGQVADKHSGTLGHGEHGVALDLGVWR